METNPLIQLTQCGQAVWMDYIRRDLITSRELNRLIKQCGLSGMTSNPTIFQKALSDNHYDEQLQHLLQEDQHMDAYRLYEKLAIQDIQMAADAFKPVYEAKHRADGFVCLEVSPGCAQDTQATINEAQRLWQDINRPNVMIKVPATLQGIPAIEELISRGINVNITLMFSLKHYEAVAKAYTRGLERCPTPQHVSSVASFFVSRVDTLVDQRLEAIGSPEALNLRGQAAIANSRMVYRRFCEIFGGEDFGHLRRKGLHVQRPLWASTSTKNPAYSDVLYVEKLIGRDTVNTMPPETLKAFRDHGQVVRDAVQKGRPEEVLRSLSTFDIDLNQVGAKLQQEGVKSFAASFEKLISALKDKSNHMNLSPH